MDSLSTHIRSPEFPRPGWIPLSLREADKTIREKERALAVLRGKTALVKQPFRYSRASSKRSEGGRHSGLRGRTRSVREKLESDLITLTESMDKMKKEIEALQKILLGKCPETQTLEFL